MSEKLQKLLARSGAGSRRHVETLIQQGKVTVDGIVAKLGDRIEHQAAAEILIDKKPVKLIWESKRRVLLYHKPLGEVCTRDDPEGRKTVFEQLPLLIEGRWVMVGRLDLNTSGLLLFTTDGEYANKLMHPSSGVQREYRVRVFGHIDPAMLKTLLHGVELEDGKAHFDSIKREQSGARNQWFRVVLTEGRNRIVRRLFESQGAQVSRLIRVRYGDYRLPNDLNEGSYAEYL